MQCVNMFKKLTTWCSFVCCIVQYNKQRILQLENIRLQSVPDESSESVFHWLNLYTEFLFSCICQLIQIGQVQFFARLKLSFIVCRPHYGFCTSVCLCILSRLLAQKWERCRKTKIGIMYSKTVVNRRASFQLLMSKVMVRTRV